MKRIFKVFTVLSVLCMAVPAFAEDKIVDWEGRLEGEEMTPAWLRTMKRGNALAYCQEFEITSKINRKWFVPAYAESYISWEDGLIAAQANTFAALGESIATDINASLSSSVSNGAKSNIKKTVLSSITTATGMEYEGMYWYKVEKSKTSTGKGKDKKVQKQTVYYVYAFYSMDMQTYDTQLKNALIAILKDGGLSQDEAQAVAATSYDLVEARKRETADHDKKKAEEQERVLQNHKLSLENRDMAMKEKGQDQQFDLDNRSVDTQQLKITETTKMSETRNKAEVDIARANANANDDASANAAAPIKKGNSVDDALAFLLAL